jgi:LDH2 family malate/lactate/ureidoglycolate dehydrogenase
LWYSTAIGARASWACWPPLAPPPTAAWRCGAGVALLRDTTHTGTLGYTTARMAADGLAAFAVAVSGPNMAYHNAAAAGVSTSPLSIAVPQGADAAPMVFDMATSVIALGKLLQAKARREAIPSGWAVDAQGQPTTDAALARFPLPLGGPKGSGLALMVEALASLLSGNPILAPQLAQPPEARRHYQNALVIAIDVNQVVGSARFGTLADELCRAIAQLPPRSGEEVLLPGQRGDREAEARRRQGIPVAVPVRKALEKEAARLDVRLPW